MLDEPHAPRDSMGFPQFSRFAGGLVALECSEEVRAGAFVLLEPPRNITHVSSAHPVAGNQLHSVT